jgi:hypothetical protein
MDESPTWSCQNQTLSRLALHGAQLAGCEAGQLHAFVIQARLVWKTECKGNIGKAVSTVFHEFQSSDESHLAAECLG